MFSVRSQFLCPRCHEAIRSNFRGVVAFAIVLGILAEIAVFLSLRAALGGTTVAVYAWLIVGGFVALVLYWLLVQRFCRVQAQ